MSNVFLYIFSAACFVAFLLASYFSAAWAKVRKESNDSERNNSCKKTIKLIIDYAKNPKSYFKTSDWIFVLLSATAATIAIVAVQLLDMHLIFVLKILISLIVLIFAASVDYNTHTIPNILSVILIVLRFVFLPFEYVYQKDVFKMLIIASIVGLIAIFVILYLIYRVTKGGFGMGDVKMLSALGFMVGITACLTTILFGMIIAAVLGVALILLKRKTKKDTVPFGPFILFGFIISVVLGVF